MSFLAPLREHLFTLASVQTTFEDELVPSRLSIGVMKKESFAGQAALTVYWFETEDKFQTDLKHNLLAIQELFHKACVKIERYNQLFFSSFRLELIGEPFNQQQKDKTERKILAIVTSLNPFIKQLLKGFELPYLNFLKEGLDGEKVCQSFRLAKVVQKIKNLELTTGVKVPIALFKKLLKKEPLKVKEEKALKDWLQALSDSSKTYVPTFTGDKKNPYVKVHYIHRLFKALSYVIPEFDCVSLEIKLEALGCQLFQKEDPFWISFRKRIVLGAAVVISGKIYQLGECLSNPNNDPNLPMVFAVSGDLFRAVIIDKNEAERGIRKFFHDKHQYGLVQPLELGHDITGAISLIERCQDKLSDIEWISEDDGLADQDIIQAYPIVALIRHMALKQPFTPYPLSPKYFGFNQSGEMRALCPLQMTEKSYEAIELFAWECAQNGTLGTNAAVFKHLLCAGELDTTRYQRLLELILRGEEMSACVSLQGKIERPDVLKAHETFYTQIKNLQESLEKEITSIYQIDDRRKFKKDLNLAITEAHRDFCPGHLLLEDFFARCKRRYLTISRPRMDITHLFPLREKLINKISRTDLTNQKMAQLWKSEKIYFSYGIYNARQQLDIFHEGEYVFKSNKINK